MPSRDPPLPLQTPIPGSEGCSDRRRSRPAALSRPGTALSPLFFLPGECGAGRRRYGCRQRAEPGGRTAQASVPDPIPLPSRAPPCCVLRTGRPCTGSRMGVWGLLCPWGNVEVSSLQRDRCSVCCQIQFMRCCALSQQEQHAACFLAFVSSGTNSSFWVGATKPSTKTSLRARWAIWKHT